MGGWSSYNHALEKYHAAIHDLFARYGSFVAISPIVPLMIGVMLLGSLCIGILRAETETDIENLWVEQNSRIIPEKHYFDSHFGGISRKESVTVNLKSFPDKSLNDLGLAMEALTSIVKPYLIWLVTPRASFTERERERDPHGSRESGRDSHTYSPAASFQRPDRPLHSCSG